MSNNNNDSKDDKTKGVLKKTFEITILPTLLVFFGYIYQFVFEWGWLQYYGIGIRFVDMYLDKVLNMSLVLAIITFLLVVEVFTAKEIKKANDNNTSIFKVFLKPWIFLPIIIYIIGMLFILYVPTDINKAVIWVPIGLVVIFAVLRLIMSSVIEKREIIFNKEDTKKIVFVSIAAILTIIAFLSFFTGVSAAMNENRNIEEFTYGEKHYVVVYERKDTFIAKEIEREEDGYWILKDDDSFRIFDYNNSDIEFMVTSGKKIKIENDNRFVFSGSVPITISICLLLPMGISYLWMGSVQENLLMQTIWKE